VDLTSSARVARTSVHAVVVSRSVQVPSGRRTAT
jgi:hypothetical protein